MIYLVDHTDCQLIEIKFEMKMLLIVHRMGMNIFIWLGINYRKADDNLPPVMTATNVEFQQFINKYHNNARDYIVPALELPEIKMKNLLPTKAEIITYIEQYENARAKYEDCKKDMRSIPKHSLPSSYSPTIWFTYLFGKQINSSTPVNPVCNIDKCIFFTQEDCAYVISNFVQWITKKVVLPSDVTSWTFSVYSVMDCDPCETLLSDMRILTQFFINARSIIEDHLDVSVLRYSCLINIVAEKFKQHDLGDIINYREHYSGTRKNHKPL
ncbi:uncharacterized protein LOC126901661 isoform X2 [Daktulosphaira vitifoliae]|uniref:uncharacterized protein LOC126901661 isoform X2 n=1 Tax=Daktulosphaira vitifoliae TaxID=58002 RepID=UPI0021AA6505|nr:uncharacterized protein LOC126901661 isoform X2 [Daktulosphaira vitifoliae]